MELNERFVIWYFIVVCLVEFGSLWYLHFAYSENERFYQREIATIKMYIKENYEPYLREENMIINGLCIDREYMLIYTKDRSYSEIMETFIHEYAHCKQGLLDPPKRNETG